MNEAAREEPDVVGSAIGRGCRERSRGKTRNVDSPIIGKTYHSSNNPTQPCVFVVFQSSLPSLPSTLSVFSPRNSRFNDLNADRNEQCVETAYLSFSRGSMRKFANKRVFFLTFLSRLCQLTARRIENEAEKVNV